MILSMTLNDLAQDVGYIAPSSTACGRSDKIEAGVSEDLPEEALAALTAAAVLAYVCLPSGSGKSLVGFQPWQRIS